ncbi:UNVERIFIED_CONTAM: hypothetical protein RMT77_018142 [Armadillidium vulgare]
MSPRSQILRLAKTLSLGNEKHQTFAKALLGSSRGKKDGSAAAASCCLLASTKTKKRMRCISNSSKQAAAVSFRPQSGFRPEVTEIRSARVGPSFVHRLGEDLFSPG